jgi:hypothetical protein
MVSHVSVPVWRTWSRMMRAAAELAPLQSLTIDRTDPSPPLPGSPDLDGRSVRPHHVSLHPALRRGRGSRFAPPFSPLVRLLSWLSSTLLLPAFALLFPSLSLSSPRAQGPGGRQMPRARAETRGRRKEVGWSPLFDLMNRVGVRSRSRCLRAGFRWAGPDTNPTQAHNAPAAQVVSGGPGVLCFYLLLGPLWRQEQAQFPSPSKWAGQCLARVLGRPMSS